MKIHEYQAKELLASYGINIPAGVMVETPQDAFDVASRFEKSVVKAQVHAGGRGKAGGVKLADSPEEAKRIADEMIGMLLVSKQTGPEGKIVRKLLVTETVDVKKELYLAITGDNENAGLVIVASQCGGTEIEEIAATQPDKIVKVPVSCICGFRKYEGLQIAKALGLEGALCNELITILDGLYRLYTDKDCSLVEINPLVVTSDNHLCCLDAKINFDDNAVFRHPDIQALRDPDEENPKEYRASQFDLNYVSLDGNIGCLVNGAGLAMATMDIIKSFGGNPANFLDVGGSATTERVKAAFEILLSDEQVKAIFINIFGGIMKCDIIAEGVVSAAREMQIKVPLIVRLEGTNVDKGRQILKESGLQIIAASDMADGAKKAVKAACEKENCR